jgi:hypothetical protein
MILSVNNTATEDYLVQIKSITKRIIKKHEKIVPMQCLPKTNNKHEGVSMWELVSTQFGTENLFPG